MKNQIRFFEEIAANAHVALNVMQYDGWLMRFANGYSGRANSISVLYPSTLPVEEKVAYCEKCYAKQGLPANFKLTQGDEDFSDFLAARGYKVVTPTDIMILDDLAVGGEAFFADCVFSDKPDEWLPYFFEYENLTNEKNQNTFRQMLSKVMVDTIYCSVIYKGRVVACAATAIEHGYALIHYVVVDSTVRGLGLGEKLCRAIIAKAKEHGAEHAYLQVVQTNGIAMNLYKKLGFKKFYSYWYMKKAITCPDKTNMVVVEYNKRWTEDFSLIKAELMKWISLPVIVQHVGSTSIPGMMAKPIIDIDIALENWADFEKVKKDLQKIGYEHEGDLGIKGREAFARTGAIYNEVLDKIDHHLYVCSVENEEYKRHVLFRDYLRNHDDARDLYNKIKQEILTEVGQDNRAGYVQMKEEKYKTFFENIISKAKNLAVQK